MGTRSKSYGCPMWEAYPGVTSLLLVKFSTHPCGLLPSSYSDRSSYISFFLRGKYAATQLLSSPFSSAVNGGASLTRGPMLFQRSLVNVTMVPCSCMCTHMCTHISDSVSLPRGVALSIYTPRLRSSSAWDREKTTHMCTEYKTERLVCERGGKT